MFAYWGEKQLMFYVTLHLHISSAVLPLLLLKKDAEPVLMLKEITKLTHNNENFLSVNIS